MTQLQAVVRQPICHDVEGYREADSERDKAFRFENNLCPVQGALPSVSVSVGYPKARGSGQNDTVATEAELAAVLRAVASRAKGRDHEAFVRHPLIFSQPISDPTVGWESRFLSLTPVASRFGDLLPGGLDAAALPPREAILVVAPRILYGSISIGTNISPQSGDYRFSYPFSLFDRVSGGTLADFVPRMVRSIFSDYDTTAESMIWMAKQNVSLVRVLRHLGYAELEPGRCSPGPGQCDCCNISSVTAHVSFNGILYNMQVWPKTANTPESVEVSGQQAYPGAEYVLDVAKAAGAADGGVYRMPPLHITLRVNGVPLPQPGKPSEPEPVPQPRPPAAASSLPAASSGSVLKQWWFWVLLALAVVVAAFLGMAWHNAMRRPRQASVRGGLAMQQLPSRHVFVQQPGGGIGLGVRRGDSDRVIGGSGGEVPSGPPLYPVDSAPAMRPMEARAGEGVASEQAV